MRTLLRVAAAATLAITGSLLGATGAGAAPPPFRYTVELSPLNDSGVSGTVVLTLEGSTLVADFDVTGLEPDRTHLRHIHGHPDDHNAACPSPPRDANGDGLISFAEGLPDYGPVQHNFGNFDTGADGTVRGTIVYDVDPAAFSPLQNRAVVFHGLTVNGVYDVSLPVACAQVQGPRPLTTAVAVDASAVALGREAAADRLRCNVRQA